MSNIDTITGLQFHTSLDEITTNNTVKDLSTNNREGAVNGSVAIVPDDTFGSCMSFNGTDDYVAITGYKGIGGAGARTVSAWIKTTATDQSIISWGD